MSKREFQTEVSQLLQLIIHSLYSHPEIFLRELISNSSDALDKLRHLTLTDEAYKSLPFDPRIDLELDEEKKTLTIADTGIGMNEEDLSSNLGTIARSGTKNFLSQLSGDAKQGLQPHRPIRRRLLQRLHGRRQSRSRLPQSRRRQSLALDQRRQDRLRNRARRARSRRHHRPAALQRRRQAVRQQLAPARRSSRSTPTTSPSPSSSPTTRASGTKRKRSPIKTRTTEQVNAASALWRRSKNEITDEDYKELYKSISGDWEDPLFWFHTKAEGSLEYTTLFYHPRQGPARSLPGRVQGRRQALRQARLHHGRRQGAAAAVPALRPRHHRQRRSAAQRQPRNPAAESHPHQHPHRQRQEDPLRTENHRHQPTGEIPQFIAEYNRPLKEGLYSDYANRETLLDLVRFKSTKVEGLTSLADVKSRMKEGQKSIYYITGGAESLLRTSPLLEIYKKKDIEVLILDDDIDEIVFSGIDKYGDLDLKAVNKTSTSEDLKDEAEPDKSEALKPLLDKLKATLGDRVKDVRASVRLADSPSCIVSDEEEPSAPDAADAARHGPEGLPRPQADTRNQSRSRDRQKAPRSSQ